MAHKSTLLFLIGLIFIALGSIAINHYENTPSFALLIFISIGALSIYAAINSYGDTSAVTSRKRQKKTKVSQNPKRKYVPSREVGEAYLPSFDQDELDKVEGLVREGSIVGAMELYMQTTGHHAMEARRYIAEIVHRLNQEAEESANS